MADSVAFYQPGTTTAYPFTPGTFEVANTGTSHLQLTFMPGAHTTFTPSRVNVAPGARASVAMACSQSETVTYYPSYYATANPNPGGRFTGWDRGKTVNVAPVGSAYGTAVTAATNTYNTNRWAVTIPGYSGQHFVGAAPVYGAGCYAMEHVMTVFNGHDVENPADLKTAVDLFLAYQLQSDYYSGDARIPAGAIPKYLTSDGSGMGGGQFDIVVANPSLHWTIAHEVGVRSDDLVMAQLAWFYGATQGFNGAWQTWFASIKAKLALAYNVWPINGTTGLQTQETPYPSVMWDYLDCVLWTGDNLGTSVMAYDFACAMQDMCTFSGDTTGASSWQAKADAMRDAVRARWITTTLGGKTVGYLPWTVGGAMDANPSLEATVYGVASGLLSATQASHASDWLAYYYAADKAAGAGGDLFMFHSGVRGPLRTWPKAYDHSGSAMFPAYTITDVSAYGASGAYENGGYWYECCVWAAATLAINHPDLALEYAAGAVADMNAHGSAWENVHADGTGDKTSYMSSTASIAGLAAPGTAATVAVTGPTPQSADTSGAAWIYLPSASPVHADTPGGAMVGAPDLVGYAATLPTADTTGGAVVAVIPTADTTGSATIAATAHGDTAGGANVLGPNHIDTPGGAAVLGASDLVAWSASGSVADTYGSARIFAPSRSGDTPGGAAITIPGTGGIPGSADVSAPAHGDTTGAADVSAPAQGDTTGSAALVGAHSADSQGSAAVSGPQTADAAGSAAVIATGSADTTGAARIAGSPMGDTTGSAHIVAVKTADTTGSASVLGPNEGQAPGAAAIASTASGDTHGGAQVSQEVYRAHIGPGILGFKQAPDGEIDVTYVPDGGATWSS